MRIEDQPLYVQKALARDDVNATMRNPATRQRGWRADIQPAATQNAAPSGGSYGDVDLSSPTANLPQIASLPPGYGAGTRSASGRIYPAQSSAAPSGGSYGDVDLSSPTATAPTANLPQIASLPPGYGAGTRSASGRIYPAQTAQPPSGGSYGDVDLPPSTMNAAAASTNAAASDPDASPTITNSGRGQRVDPSLPLISPLPPRRADNVSARVPDQPTSEASDRVQAMYTAAGEVTDPNNNMYSNAARAVGNLALDARDFVFRNPNAGLQRPSTVAAAPAAAPAAVSAPVTDPRTFDAAQLRRSERGEYNPSYPGTIKQVPPGQPQLAAEVSPAGTQYKSSPTSGAGITRVDVKGQSPLFTNMEPGYALDDINKKRSTPQPSVEGFMNTVKSGSLGLLAPSATMQSGGGGGYGGNARAQRAQQLFDLADEIASSGGIVDAWRARGMRKRAQRMDERSIQADSNAITSEGQDVQRRGQDLTYNLGTRGQDVTSRGQDLTAALSQRGQDLQHSLGNRQVDANLRGQDLTFLPHIGDAAIGRAVADGLETGDREGVRELLQMDKPTHAQPNEWTTYDSGGNPVGYNKQSGAVKLLPTYKQLMLQQQKEDAAAAALAAAKKKAGGQ